MSHAPLRWWWKGTDSVNIRAPGQYGGKRVTSATATGGVEGEQQHRHPDNTTAGDGILRSGRSRATTGRYGRRGLVAEVVSTHFP